jgi:hypothetical protein
MEGGDPVSMGRPPCTALRGCLCDHGEVARAVPVEGGGGHPGGSLWLLLLGVCPGMDHLPSALLKSTALGAEFCQEGLDGH